MFSPAGSADTISLSVIILSSRFHAGGSGLLDTARGGSAVHPDNARAAARTGGLKQL